MSGRCAYFYYADDSTGGRLDRWRMLGRGNPVERTKSKQRKCRLDKKEDDGGGKNSS